MNTLTPWKGLGGLRREMDEMLERFFEPTSEWFTARGEWSPRLDVSETKDAVVVKAETPGIDQQDIGVLLERDLLTIKREKKQEKEEKDEQYYRVERAYGSFMRTVRLPAPVEPSKVTATFKNGLLTVTLPKASGAAGTTIPVKAT